jgi:hypothetical protein
MPPPLPRGTVSPPHVSRPELDRLMSLEHAENVAWRVVKDWLEANLALIAPRWPPSKSLCCRTSTCRRN